MLCYEDQEFVRRNAAFLCEHKHTLIQFIVKPGQTHRVATHIHLVNLLRMRPPLLVGTDEIPAIRPNRLLFDQILKGDFRSTINILGYLYQLQRSNIRCGSSRVDDLFLV